MKIAFISYEYPPDTAHGGIATYVKQAARMLIHCSHHVEVFTASKQRSGTNEEEGILVHRVIVNDRSEFSEKIGWVFAERHELVQFDVLEGPECGADAVGAVKIVPEIPLVVKLHTPQYLMGIISNPPMNWISKTRITVGALRRGKLPQFPKPYNPNIDPERSHTLDADEIVAPSTDIGKRLIKDWGLDSQKVVYFPYPYLPTQELLNIPIDTQTNVVSFIGRLEIRKGILDLAKAIPQILRQFPQTKFRFVGAPWPSPQPHLDMQQYLEVKLSKYRYALEFTGHVSLEQIPSFLATTDICVFPSRWENFPNVCLEAMAAARGVVGSSAGGMLEMLDGSKAGLLVPPNAPDKIAEAVIKLLKNPELRMQLGQAARDRILSEYNLERIARLQEASYIRAIKRRQALGKRVANNCLKENISKNEQTHILNSFEVENL